MSSMSSISSGSSDCPWWVTMTYYQSADCSAAPYELFIQKNHPDHVDECAPFENATTGNFQTSVECASDWSSFFQKVATDYSLPYLLVTAYKEEACSVLMYGDVYVADGRCQVTDADSSHKATAYASGQATYEFFQTSTFCTGKPEFTLTTNDSSVTTACSLQPNMYYYTLSVFTETAATSAPSSGSASPTVAPTPAPTTATPDSVATGGSSSNTTPIVVGVIVAVVLVLVALAWFCCKKRRSHQGESPLDESLLVANASGLWNDPAIISARLPRNNVQIQALLSRGGYGEVHREAKLTASLEHPNIIQLVGVAWNTFKDLCVVLEFADNGDLRMFLESLHNDHHPMGFNADKVKIALHVSHALTYLHSLDQPILHRDLKSRNILLNEDLDAKVTDFGVSREIATETMTTGIGSSLWMAPEVMTGGRYNEKADIFSFGVVLSELDTQMLPYRYVNENSRTVSSGPSESGSRKSLPNAALIQRIAIGQLQVQFSDEAAKAPSLVELGRACMSMDPNARPSASEALFCLQKAFKFWSSQSNDIQQEAPPK
ncbi:hypothetical protein JM18_005126 [Phytophthora kernoviae]|uniref:Protein kinase domain-containing protein n=2 Tax=Phytophthora kernoviae TaxID=325452 RepID=A0A922AKY9_9STRA|nr:hypothetical protein G195_004144 [Phytophthora kernoviae 00238/432]KAG2524937.1 hypothetical protein JM18_005126 [Phytophthora kernoviae]